MKKKIIFLIQIIFILLFLINYNNIAANDLPIPDLVNNSYILNILGSSEYIPDYWKPHSYNLKSAEWSISFRDKVTMFLNNNASEFGHIACGSWWVPNFLYARKLPLKNVKSLVISVDLYLSDVKYNHNNALLRMAVASAINMSGVSRYTELDFWDSPALYKLLYSNSDKYFNGSDEYSYNINQIHIGQWITLEIDFIPYIKKSWEDLSQASLESIYIVIESDCREHISIDIVSLDVRNLVIRVIE